MKHFRFEDLEIWRDAIDLGDRLFDIAELADSKKLYKFAEQLRSSGLSISNNITEGSGSFSKKEFGQFLNISRRSVFECANMIIIFHRRSIIDEKEKTKLLADLAYLSRRITSFRKTLN
ncbi:MAG: four helix bundle protein [Bacteroidales bacterium]|nr:four helix bundle protein [Bacteroidales bacterium]